MPRAKAPEYKFVGQHIEIDKPQARPKKLTATRFASVLGLNRWNTPFQIWLQLTRVWEPPFEETIYTHAGKVIEPKIIHYLQTRYFMDIKSPTDIYGANYFSKTYGDFYPDTKVFGGMWDVLGDDFIVEIKTTKRAEDWADGNVPEYYKLQAALYAYLSGYDKFIMTGSFLEEADYDHPELFEPSAENTIVKEFSLTEEYPDFVGEYVEPALEWWHKYVEGTKSPRFDEKADAEALKALRTNVVDVNDDEELATLLDNADKLQQTISQTLATIEDSQNELKDVKTKIKKQLQAKFRDNDDHAEVTSTHFTYSLGKSVRTSVDQKAMEVDGILDKYKKETETYTLRMKELGEA